MNDNIDPSHWITSGDIITPERAAKGDLDIERKAPTRAQADRGRKGDISFAQAHVRNLMNHLREAKDEHGAYWLTDQHVRDGDTYEIWRMIFRARVGYRNNPIYGDELARMSRMLIDDEIDADDYSKLIRGLGYHARLIDQALEPGVTRHDVESVRDPRNYRIAFDCLSQIMERLRDKRGEKNRCENIKTV